jgi:hypothetical protein
LCESVTVPFLKPDFLLAELYLVLVGAETNVTDGATEGFALNSL